MKTIYHGKILTILSIVVGSIVFSQAIATNKSESSERDRNSSIVFIPPLAEKPQIIQGEMKADLKLPLGVKFQNELEAWNTDNRRLAEELGVTKESVDISIAFQEAFTRYANMVRERYSDQISGVWVEAVPATIGKIRFIGEVPSELAKEVEKRGQGDKIVLIGGGSIQENVHSHRVQLVARALGYELNLTNFTCSYNVFEDVIDIEIIHSENTVPLDKARIIKAIQNQAKKSGFRGSVAKFESNDIRFNETYGTDPIINLEYHLGGVGANLLFSYSPVCTTGWSVVGPFGDGLITAGHCAQAFGGLESYTTNLFQFGITIKALATNWLGDAAYYDIDGSIASDDFYADISDVRDTVGVMSVQQMLGKFACRYGRKSGVSCGHKIISTTACRIIGSNFICNLAQTTLATSLPGDSGGPWYRLNFALGVHVGSSTNFSYFMPAEKIENYWGLTVKH